MDDDTRALLDLLGDDSRALLLDVAKALQRIEARQASDVPPADVREHMAEESEHMAETTAHIAQTTAAAPIQAAALDQQFDEQGFITKQLITIMQGTRTDIVLMRATLRELAALLEQTLRGRVEDEEAERWRVGDADRRMSSIPDRRRAS